MNETKKRRGRPSVYTDADRDIMREEIAKGRKGWVLFIVWASVWH